MKIINHSTLQTTKMEELIEKYHQIYKENLSSISNSIQGVSEIRKAALGDFLTKGFPEKKDERYKHTFIKNEFNNSYLFDLKDSSYKFSLDDVFHCDVPNLNTETISVINGKYAEQEKLTVHENGLIIGSLKEASIKYPEIFQKYFSKSINNNDVVSSLNTLLSIDGFFVYVPKNLIVEHPIQLINILSGKEDLSVSPRNLFIIEENSQVKLVVCDHTLSANKFLSNSVTEIFAEENAIFDFYNLQNQHNGASNISSVFIKQKKHSVVSAGLFTLHGGLVRNNVNVIMDDEHCENNLYGLYLTDRFQHIDNYVNIEHSKPNCRSNQLFKGILDDTATGAFNGRILVKQDAQNTVAFQRNNNILLTNDAKINTKPQLEIYADDVKCSHGATVGRLDENAMFYMRSRGISEKEARMLLMFGFAYEVIKEIKVDGIRERIDDMVAKRLRGELSRCSNCVINCC